jgi:hypothetical protein
MTDPFDAVFGLPDDREYPPGSQVTVHITGQVVRSHDGMLVVAVELPDDDYGFVVVDLAAAGVSTNRSGGD